MYPTLIDFGMIDLLGFKFRLAIHSFGFMLVIAFYTTYFILDKDLKKLKYEETLASDLVFWAALGGVLGSKVYHLLENMDQLIIDPIGMIFSGSGLVFLGGLIGGTISVSIILHKNNLPWLVFADIVAPLLILGYGIGRIGCFLVGDDYGIPTSLPWGLSFPNGLPPSTSQVFELYFPWIDISNFEPGLLKVHPTQIYEFIICLIIFFYLYNKRLNIKVKGTLFFTYLILAGFERFFIEFIRTNEKYFLSTFSGAQIISFFMISIGLSFILRPIKIMKENSE
ncbi:MAG: prolipoprotein diacylglyceryl transferase [Candidatus Neomarinimicrobiota bacterium]